MYIYNRQVVNMIIGHAEIRERSARSFSNEISVMDSLNPINHDLTASQTFAESNPFFIPLRFPRQTPYNKVNVNQPSMPKAKTARTRANGNERERFARYNESLKNSEAPLSIDSSVILRALLQCSRHYRTGLMHLSETRRPNNEYGFESS